MANATIAPDPDADRLLGRVGRRLAAARRRRGATLAEVATTSGLSPAYVNQVETGSANPTLRALARIAAALGTDVETAVGGVPASGEPFAAYFARRPGVLDTPGTTGTWDRGAEGGHALRPRLVHGGPGDHAAPVRHDGEEFLLVLSGRCRLHVGGDARDLDAGDSCHFAAGESHHLSNTSPDLTLVVVLGGTPR